MSVREQLAHAEVGCGGRRLRAGRELRRVDDGDEVSLGGREERRRGHAAVAENGDRPMLIDEAQGADGHPRLADESAVVIGERARAERDEDVALLRSRRLDCRVRRGESTGDRLMRRQPRRADPRGRASPLQAAAAQLVLI